MVIVLLTYYAAALFILNSIPPTPFYRGSDHVLLIYDPYTVLLNAILLAVTCPLLYLFLKRDIRHQLNAIAAMNHWGEQKELEVYLLAYEASFLELKEMSFSGYPAFDNSQTDKSPAAAAGLLQQLQTLPISAHVRKHRRRPKSQPLSWKPG